MSTLSAPDARQTALSKNFHHNNPTVVSAYARCRRAEIFVLTDLESTTHTDTARATLDAQLVFIRLLGHLMDKGPGDAAASHVAESVVSATDHEQLVQVGKLYLQHFVRPFWRANAPTPESSRVHSPIDGPRRSFETTQDMIRVELIPHPTDYQEARQSAFARDGFRCVVSGAFHSSAVRRNKELLQRLYNRSLSVDITHCCYIIPRPPNMDLDDSKLEYSNMWGTLESMGYPQISTDLAGVKIHSLRNILTLTPFWHNMFDSLEVWFEATDEPHRYEVCTSEPYFVASRNGPRFVTFKSTSPELELPSPELLGLHAACCRVAHMSGAVGYLHMLDKLGEDWNYAVSAEKFADALTAKLYNIQGVVDRAARAPVSCSFNQ